LGVVGAVVKLPDPGSVVERFHVARLLAEAKAVQEICDEAGRGVLCRAHTAGATRYPHPLQHIYVAATAEPEGSEDRGQKLS
jgi:uncharacterized protein YerC